MNPRTRFVIVSIATALSVAATARLGWWQLDRAAQKTALQTALDARAALPPLAAADVAATAQDAALQHHRRVRLQGRWSAAHTLYLDNRQHQGSRPGFIVLTPLLLDDGRAVLVQRGWAPRDANERARVPAVAVSTGPVAIEGRIAPPPARLYEFDGAASGPIRQNLDLDAFARESGLARLAPLSVLQVEPAPPDGLQRAWPAPSTGVAKHHGYAFQWFALAALIAFLYVWFQFIQPRRRRA
jgi:surfeit locus 1 family protein